MFDLHTAVQTALTPVVTIPVIAALAIVIVAQAYFDARRMKARLRSQAIRLGKMTAMLLAEISASFTRETERQVAQAINATYDTMKDIGFDKLASGDVTFEGIMFGGPLPQAERRRRQGREAPPFSLDELKEALGGERRYSSVKPGVSPHSFEEPMKNTEGATAGLEGNGGQKGQRPYHKATTDFDLGGRSPRAG